MARSRRSKPFSGITTAASDKEEKVIFNRRVRHRNAQILRIDGDEARLKDRRLLYSQWLAKDGKFRFDAVARPELMRK